MDRQVPSHGIHDLRRLREWPAADRDPAVPAEFDRMLRSHKRGFRAGTTLKLEGEESGAVYCVLSGWLSLSKSLQDGQRQIVDFLLPGGILNPSSADRLTSSLQIEALTYVTVAIVPRSVWDGLSRESQVVHDMETQAAAAFMARLSERMLRLGKGTAETRTAYALLELCVRLAASGRVQCGKFHLPLRQQQLGDFIGLSSVHVCRTLRRMSRKGIIATEDHMDVTILDMHALSRIAGVEPETLRLEIVPDGGAGAHRRLG